MASYVNIDGRLRGVAGAPIDPRRGLDLQLAASRVGGSDRRLRAEPGPRRLAVRLATGDMRVRYTFKAPPDTAATGVSFTRFDVTASGLMQLTVLGHGGLTVALIELEQVDD